MMYERYIVPKIIPYAIKHSQESALLCDVSLFKISLIHDIDL